jgi:hypothetical protein
MGHKFPKPDKVNFPSVEKKLRYNFEICQEDDGSRGKQQKVGKSICLLKSGNILISYIWRDEKNFLIKSCLAIYSVPKLQLIEEYSFDNEVDETIYQVDCAIQLKNGNIFSICDRLYIFEGESISNGPKITSEKINNAQCQKNKISFEDPHDIFKQKLIIKNGRTFQCDFMFEIKEGLVLYTYCSNFQIFFLNIDQLDTEGKKIYEYKLGEGMYSKTYQFDIIRQSEYYPENLYICANLEKCGWHSADSIFLVFNFDEFCEKGSQERKPLYNFKVSESQNIYGMCEYDEKFLLLDTIKNGIYIIDIESKQKIAVAKIQVYYEGESKIFNYIANHGEKKDFFRHDDDRFSYLYRNMIKLKDGQVLTFDGEFYITDIKEQKKLPAKGWSAKFVICGNYFITFGLKTELNIFRLYDD